VIPKQSTQLLIAITAITFYSVNCLALTLHTRHMLGRVSAVNNSFMSEPK